MDLTDICEYVKEIEGRILIASNSGAFDNDRLTVSVTFEKACTIRDQLTNLLLKIVNREEVKLEKEREEARKKINEYRERVGLSHKPYTR